MISREKTFAFCCFEISKGINFREKGPKTRKFLPAKVVKHTQTIRRQQPTNCLTVFDHFVDLALKPLKTSELTDESKSFLISIDVFRTLSNIYDGTFLQK